jgi:hypothetical protein
LSVFSMLSSVTVVSSTTLYGPAGFSSVMQRATRPLPSPNR